ncbi:hypothetical protein THASP1DRAFT_32888 [Thamnocephalis sphaerospora]|uniref:Uncharacterized protein n=1 Tax=Thamnocephalis sphaerospora TaxID=78915 RepID=A0A4P9XIT1_9FUNG|nr:hypothetical protein THASP1DRAFT_32888 [Thamnocephalis sphaerospora]|eukprot:RKP05271.1 hypothetical protein THASP1DRAFT_32888 [Thamnocephalis sphaerospora]
MGCAEKFETLEAMSAHMKENGCFAKVPSADSDIWKDPKYLFPTVENDPLLMWVDDEDELEEVEVEVGAVSSDTEGVHEEEDEDDDIEVVLGVKGEQTRRAGRVAEGLFAAPRSQATRKLSATEHAHVSSSDATATTTHERKHATTTITVTRPRRFSHVDGVIAEEVKLNTGDVPDLSDI